jgi:hypothetical protein
MTGTATKEMNFSRKTGYETIPVGNTAFMKIAIL